MRANLCWGAVAERLAAFALQIVVDIHVSVVEPLQREGVGLGRLWINMMPLLTIESSIWNGRRQERASYG